MNAKAAVDPRVARTRQVVVDATIEELMSSGFERITIEAIAERTGVARSTIYRNWSDPGDLYVEAFDRICAFEPVPDLGSLTLELRALADELVNAFSSGGWGSVLPSFIGAVAHDDSLTTAHRAFADRRRAQVSDVFRRGVERGEITGKFPPEVLAASFASGFFFQLLMVRLPVDATFVDTQIDMVLALAES